MHTFLSPLLRTLSPAFSCLLLCFILSTQLHSTAAALDLDSASSCEQVARGLAYEIAADDTRLAKSLEQEISAMLGCAENSNGTDWDGTCPEGTSACGPTERNGARACCPSGTHCESYGASVWCSPDNSETCSKRTDGRTHFCPGNGTDHACCHSAEECSTLYGSAVCKNNVEPNACPREKRCGSYACCNAGGSFKCKALGPVGGEPKVCNYTSCNEGQVLCRGEKYSICCPTGTCSGTSNGNPSCIPVATPTPTPTPTASPTETPNAPTKPETKSSLGRELQDTLDALTFY